MDETEDDVLMSLSLEPLARFGPSDQLGLPTVAVWPRHPAIRQARSCSPRPRPAPEPQRLTQTE